MIYLTDKQVSVAITWRDNPNPNARGFYWGMTVIPESIPGYVLKMPDATCPQGTLFMAVPKK
jgi:hypothetical protein